MNTIEYLTQSEYESLLNNIDFTNEELFIVKHMRLNDLTNDGMAQRLNISDYKFKKYKSNALLKIFHKACE